jgi:hypothetical protein
MQHCRHGLLVRKKYSQPLASFLKVWAGLGVVLNANEISLLCFVSVMLYAYASGLFASYTT